MHLRIIAITLVLTLGASTAPLAAADSKPVLLYCRYFNAKGETRYLPDGTYSDVLGKLREIYDVRVSDSPLDAEALKGVAVVLVANPNDKAVGTNPPPHHCSAADVATLTSYVQNGGGFIAMANQENHNVEINDFNQLLGTFGMKYENRYTDVKKIVLPADAPILGGLRWAYYTGNQVLLQADHPAKPRAIVTNDLAQKPEKGERDEPGVLLGGSEPGKGRVLVVTDSGWISNDALSGKGIAGVAIKEHDNWEIFRRLVQWVTHEE